MEPVLIDKIRMLLLDDFYFRRDSRESIVEFSPQISSSFFSSSPYILKIIFQNNERVMKSRYTDDIAEKKIETLRF